MKINTTILTNHRLSKNKPLVIFLLKTKSKKMKKNVLTLLVIATFSITSFAQIGVNSDNSAPDASAQLDIKSTDKGLLIPRLTTAQRNAIPTPAIGLMVFDTDLQEIFINNSDGWKQGTMSKLPLKLSSSGYSVLEVTNNILSSYPGISTAAEFKNKDILGYTIIATSTSNRPTILTSNAFGSGIEASSGSTGYGGTFKSTSGVAILGLSQNNNSIMAYNNSNTFATAKFINNSGGQAMELNGNLQIIGKIINEAYQYPSFENNWTNFGAEWNTAKFYKSKDGRVYLEGVVTGGTNPVIYTLPVGYRPAQRIFFIVSQFGAGRGRVDIQANGQVSFEFGTSTTQVGLDGISFRVD
jgi:hypothetical protein